MKPSPHSGQVPARWSHLAALTWPEARALLRPETVVILPIGAIEAHGPHLPLDTDVIIAAAMAERAADRLAKRGVAVVIAPPVVYGVSYVGACFPGTTPIPAGVLTAQLVSLVQELARWGPRRFAFVNAHLEPAHIAALRDAGRAAEDAADVRIAFADQREERWAAALSEEFRQGARHGGAFETSIVLAAAANRVRQDELSGLPPVWIDLPGRLRDGARTFAEAGGTQGYFGDPMRASADEGERLLAALGDMVATAVDELGLRDEGRET